MRLVGERSPSRPYSAPTARMHTAALRRVVVEMGPTSFGDTKAFYRASSCLLFLDGLNQHIVMHDALLVANDGLVSAAVKRSAALLSRGYQTSTTRFESIQEAMLSEARRCGVSARKLREAHPTTFASAEHGR